MSTTSAAVTRSRTDQFTQCLLAAVRRVAGVAVDPRAVVQDAARVRVPAEGRLRRGGGMAQLNFHCFSQWIG